MVINDFIKTLKEVEKKKQIENKIKSLQFKINTNHKYKKYEQIFKKFFQKSKDNILKNSRYWTKDYYNYLSSFIVYTGWLFTDLENKNYENIKSYMEFFKKIVRNLK